MKRPQKPDLRQQIEVEQQTHAGKVAVKMTDRTWLVVDKNKAKEFKKQSTARII